MQEACCVAQVNQKQITTVSQLQEALADIDHPSRTSRSPELYDFDHIYSSDPRASLKLWQGGNATAAVLYATPGSQCFHGMHKLLKTAMARQHGQGGLQKFDYRQVQILYEQAGSMSCNTRLLAQHVGHV